jgi:hypothetical protein
MAGKCDRPFTCVELFAAQGKYVGRASSRGSWNRALRLPLGTSRGQSIRIATGDG